MRTDMRAISFGLLATTLFVPLLLPSFAAAGDPPAASAQSVPSAFLNGTAVPAGRPDAAARVYGGSSKEIIYRGPFDIRSRGTLIDGRSPGPVGSGCIMAENLPRPGESREQYQWRICRSSTCHLCPDGQTWGAGRASVPQQGPAQ